MSGIIFIMGLYVKREYERTEFQNSIAKGLDEKAKNAAKVKSKTNSVEDSAYLEGTKKTTLLIFFWIILFIIALLLIVFGLEY